MQFKVIFTIKQALHPLTEVVDANDVKSAEQVVRQMCVEAGVTIKQIVSVIQIS